MNVQYRQLLVPVVLCAGLSLTASSVSADVLPGQIDDYEDGTTGGWQHGMPNPDEPRVVSDGGPEGDGDAYVQVSSNGGFSRGGKLIMYNVQDRWTGRYGGDSPSEAVVGLEVDFINQGEEPLTLWFGFDAEYMADEGLVFASAYTSGFELLPGTGWQHASFSLLPDDMTSNGDISEILNNVVWVWLFHNDEGPIHPAFPIEAVLGMDNLTAVGEMEGEIPGDYNRNGRVEQADLDLVLLNWNDPVANLPAEWINERPTSGIIDQAELDGVLLNWNRTSPALGTAAAVPEPSTWTLIGLAAGLGIWLGRLDRFTVLQCAPAPARPR